MSEPRVIEITVPFDAHRLSLNARLHWRQRRRLNEQAKEAAGFGWLQAGRPVAAGPVTVEVLVRRGRMIDPDNALAGCKACIDALFKGAVTPDDSQRWITFSGVRVESNKRWKDREEILFRITEQAGEQ